MAPLYSLVLGSVYLREVRVLPKVTELEVKVCGREGIKSMSPVSDLLPKNPFLFH